MRKMLWFISFVGMAGLMVGVLPWFIEPTPAGPADAPDPGHHRDPVIRVYGADVWGLRGRYAIHTWIAVKGFGEDSYTNYKVIGWLERRGLPVLKVSQGPPDVPWFGSPPILLHAMEGAEAAVLIERVKDAALSYPFQREYTMFPGPNSNSFTAWVGLEVPELGLDLPFKAIGSGWMESNYDAAKIGPGS